MRNPTKLESSFSKRKKIYYEFSKVDTCRHLKLTYRGLYFESWHAYSY
jgi:hypothetical protein